MPKQGGVVRVNLFHPRVTTPFRENYGPEQESECLLSQELVARKSRGLGRGKTQNTVQGKHDGAFTKNCSGPYEYRSSSVHLQPPRAPLRPTPPLRRQLPVEGVGRMRWGVSSGGEPSKGLWDGVHPLGMERPRETPRGGWSCFTRYGERGGATSPGGLARSSSLHYGAAGQGVHPLNLSI